MKQIGKKTELLCPAGSPAALFAAIEAGADAVYLGGVAFNARMGAKNFTADELRDGISLAHAYGAKVYLTANTLVYDKELDDFLRAAEDAYLMGADALILADLGGARMIRERIPIELHASTQVSGHGAFAAKELAEMGFSRMVCAREMSARDLRSFVEKSPIEAEVFVHGALCVCHSGQCLFSSLVGGRSGNRGECAQPCRLPFGEGKKQSYPLSLKDLCLARYVPELMEMGIASFKIEGRMKSPEYVRDTAKIWRRLIDENRGANDDELRELASIFSRGGFTDGYYTERIDRKMLGVRSEQDKQSTRVLTPFDKITRKLPIDLSVSVAADAPVRMTLTARDGRSVTVEGEIPQTAKTAPMNEESVLRSVTKLGNTPYIASTAHAEVEERLMLPISSLNALRRSAVDALNEAAQPKRSAEDFGTVSPLPKLARRGASRSAVFYFPDRIPDEAYDFFDLIYTPLERYDGSTNGVFLPPVIFDGEREEIIALLHRAESLGATHALVGNLGHFSLLEGTNLIPHGDFRLNITNRESASLWEERGLCDYLLSPELTLPRLRDIGGGSRVTVYGRIPLMVTEKCVGKELGSCENCTDGRSVLTDRRGVRFPVLRAWKHRSLIVNSVPHYMADKQDELARNGLTRQHFIFTTESKKEISALLRAYEKGLPPTGEVRRIK
ncbi:MAG: U32 family peptidase [Clostridia bacterium]|nr:U32 family peptidase [Clostridia bacterium]